MILVIIASVLNLLLLVLIACILPGAGLPEEGVQLLVIALIIVAPVLSLVGLWYPPRKRKKEPDALKDVKEQLDQIQVLLQRAADKT